MAVDFSETLIVAISATALFDLSYHERIFEELLADNPYTAHDEFANFVRSHENELLPKGTGFALMESLLNLNRFNDKSYDDESPLVEVVIISKSTPDMGIQVLNSIQAYNLPITRSAFLSGLPVADYIKDFSVDLFLTTSPEDAQEVSDAKVCACAIVDTIPNDTTHLSTTQLRIAFDGDAVLFDESGELIYQQKGLKAFHEYEQKMKDAPIDKGPYADFLIKLSALQKKLPYTPNSQKNPICIALVTARNAPADLRAINTLRAWGVTVDLAFFLGGLEKTAVLKTFAPHIFFDDSIKHIDRAKTVVPSALVPYRSNSPLNDLAKNDLSKKTYQPKKQPKPKK